MANVRFLDQVAVNSFANGTNTSTAYGATLPRYILPGETFTISANTNASGYNLTVLGTLIIQPGPLLELSDGSTVNAHGTLWIENTLDNQGTIHNSGTIIVGGNGI